MGQFRETSKPFGDALNHPNLGYINLDQMDVCICHAWDPLWAVSIKSSKSDGNWERDRMCDQQNMGFQSTLQSTWEISKQQRNLTNGL